MKHLNLALALCLSASVAFGGNVTSSNAGTFIQSSGIEVVNMVKASATRQLKYKISVTPQRSITVSGVNSEDRSIKVEDIQHGIYNVKSNDGMAVSIVVEDAENIKGVKLTNIKGQYGESGEKQNMLDYDLAGLMPAAGGDKELRVEVAMLKIDPLAVPSGTGELNPEFHLDVSYE